MKFLILAVLLCFATELIHAQTFEKSYGGPGTETGVDVATLTDQSIILVGTSNSYGNGGDDIVVTKTDSAGLLLWSRYFGGLYNDKGKGVAIGSDNAIYACGVKMGASAGTEDILLTKISKDGVVLWTKTYGGTNTDVVNDIAFRADKIYMIGSTKSYGAGQDDIYFIKTDTAGNVITTKTIGTTGDDLGNSISKTADGNLLIGGRSDFIPATEVFVAKINLLGDTLWTKRFDCNAQTSVISSIAATAVIELSDKQILVSGTGNDNTNFVKAFHIRLDAFGNQIYLKFFSYTNTYVLAIDAISTSNGGYIISSDYPSGLNKYDNTGTLIWRRTYQNRYYGSGYQDSNTSGRLAKSTGGKILFTGTSYLVNGSKEIYLAKLDSNGIAYSTPDPVITASSTLTFCEGDSVQLTVPLGYQFYQWQKFGAATQTYYAGYSNKFTAKQSGGYLCVMIKSNGVRITSYVTVIVNPLPQATISSSGSVNFCAASGESTTLNVPAGYTSYQWKLSGIVINGATSNTYVANATGSYNVTLTNGCGILNTAAINVFATLPPTCSLGCPSNDCNQLPCSGLGDLVATNYGSGAIYKWYFNSTLIATTTIPNIHAQNAGTYSCEVTTSCGVSLSNTFTVYANSTYPNNNIIVTTPPSGCGAGTSILLTAPNLYSSYYQWYLNNSPISGANSSTYIATINGDYSLSEYNNAGNCTGLIRTYPITFTANANPAPQITAPSGISACTGSLPLTVNVTGSGIGYQWYKNGSSVFLANASTYQATTSGAYYCRVYNPSCGTNETNSINMLFGLPNYTTNYQTGDICQGSSKFISIYLTYGFTYTYQWKLNGLVIPGATAQGYNCTQAGTYYCDVSNTCGTVPSTAINFAIDTLSTPAITGSLNTLLCTNQNYTMSTTLNNGNQYLWLKNGNYIVSGTNLNTYTFNQAGSYTVRVTDLNGCSGTSQPLILTSGITPTATLKSSDYPLICWGSPLLLKGSSYSNAIYKWYRNNLLISNAIDSFYMATMSGSYYYTVTNSCGSATSTSFGVIAKAKPDATLSASGNTTFCNGDSVILSVPSANVNSYLWFKNNISIAGANTETTTAKSAGTYNAIVTNNYGCFKKSSSISVTVPCRLENELDNSIFTINIYPNPSSDYINIEFADGDDSKDLQLSVYDMQGRLVNDALRSVKNNLWISNNLEAGMYLLKVQNNITIISKTFEIIK